ncbi:hypothetical protein ABW20_dc0105141 [Dactylellina cionopaga]|nr:hypothetical protein ABW20_dc0105141 [Dactylellina cionopaga]
MIGSTGAVLLGLVAFASAAALPQVNVLPPTSSVPVAGAPAASDIAGACASINLAEQAFLNSSQASGKFLHVFELSLLDTNLPLYTGGDSFEVDPKIAFDCLQSVPLEKQAALDFIRNFQKFMQFQSTIAYLANPPANSGQEPVDIPGGLSAIHKHVEDGVITQWYDVENQINGLLLKGRDEHLRATWPLQNLFRFRVPMSLVSLSPDGKQAAKIYLVEEPPQPGASDFKTSTSAVTKIDGEDVVTAIQKLMDGIQTAQSPDARWNYAFASINPRFQGAIGRRNGFPNATAVSLTFENGTTVEFKYTADAPHKPGANVWSTLQTGQDIWAKLVNAEPGSDPFAVNTTEAGTVKSLRVETNHSFGKRQVDAGPPISELVRFNSTSKNVPEAPAFIQDINDIIRGCFVNKTAILNIAEFQVSSLLALNSAQKTIELFLVEAKTRGAENLIIDVRGNFGGIIAVGHDAYGQIFPNANPALGSRLRHHPASLKLAQAWTQLVPKELINGQIPAVIKTNCTDASANISAIYDPDDAFWAAEGGLSQSFSLDKDGKPFTSFESYFGPVTSNGDKFTSVLKHDFSSIAALGQALSPDPKSGLDFTGYGHLASYKDRVPVFKPENIVLLTDSTCASTCNTFSELIRNEQRIRTVAVGGRPDANKPAAAIGGVRGSQVLLLHRELLPLIKFAEEQFPPKSQAEKTAWDEVMPTRFKLNVFEAAVNYKDVVRATDPTQTPLQFYLEPADCRIFYTEKTLKSSHELWAQVEGLAWGADDAGCARGSLKNVTVITGDATGIPISFGN